MLSVKEWIAKMSRTTLVGEIKQYAGSNEPTGWLKCDGRAVSRTKYAALFSVIGTIYGTGDGSTTFNLPDMRDRFPVGAGSSYALNDKGGANTVTLTTNQMPSHTHRLLMRYNSGTMTGYPVEPSSGQVKETWGGGRVENTGGGQAHENRPPYIGINFLIYMGGGVLLNCIFKAFSHLQEIGGGIDAGYQKSNSKDIKEHKNTFNCAFCYGICGSKERKRLYNRTYSKWIYVSIMVCDKDRRLGWRGLQFNAQCSNGKGLDSAKQHRNRKWKCDLLRLIHTERLSLTSERGWAVC